MTELIMISIMVLIPAILGILTRSAGVFGLLMVLGTVYLMQSDTNRRENICVDKKVIQVGGCSRYGDCRVLNDDGTDGFARMPLAGMISSECHTKENPVWWDRDRK